VEFAVSGEKSLGDLGGLARKKRDEGVKKIV
jgi:hypothetical protein